VANNKSKRLEPVGWIFWLIAFVLSIPLCLYIVWQAAFTSTLPIVRIAASILLAAVFSACLSVAVNFVIDYIDGKRQRAARKIAKKKKKRK
jgi:uncharacterized membrane protein YesL